MLVNSSSTSKVPRYDCSMSDVSTFLSFSSNGIRTCIILPLCTLILYRGHQRWRQQRSFKAESHSDLFAYNLTAMELIWSFAVFFYLAGLFVHHPKMMSAGEFICSISFFGEICFHVLTCVERYLAVIHPIPYRNLKNARGVRLRNVLIACVWLLCLVLTSISTFGEVELATITTLTFFALSILVVTFCSLSVLRILIRSGPREGGGQKRPADPSKQRAFITIMTISCFVWLWFAVLLVLKALKQSSLISEETECVMIACLSWFNLPTCLMSPLLYFHRAGKLPHCRGK